TAGMDRVGLGDWESPCLRPGAAARALRPLDPRGQDRRRDREPRVRRDTRSRLWQKRGAYGVGGEGGRIIGGAVAAVGAPATTVGITRTETVGAFLLAWLWEVGIKRQEFGC